MAMASAAVPPPSDPPGEDVPKSEEPDYKKVAAAAQKELAALKREKLSESERYKSERDEARKEADEAKAKSLQAERSSRLVEEAKKLGITNPERGAKMLAAEITWGEDGKIIGLKDAAAALKADFPGIFAPLPSPRGGGGGTTRTALPGDTAKLGRSSAMDALIRSQLS